MNVDILVAEIGSTTTTINAFVDVITKEPKFLGQGQAPTSVEEGDVRIGLRAAIDDLSGNLRVESLSYDHMLASSSAAGGLKMTVHGLVHDMTARAAKEAALGAGAIPHMVTSGKLRPREVDKIKRVKPNIVLLAGGVDYGERDTALHNAELLAELNLPIPLVYAGNIENRDEISDIFAETKFHLHIVENVYPKIDSINIEPTRAVIQQAFEEHIVHAAGMEHVRDMVDGPIIPTPGAVMNCAKLLYHEIGDLLVLDVGGATTDLHSVTEGSEEISRILISPEPRAKRSVEGDLGVFINRRNVLSQIGEENAAHQIGMDVANLMELLRDVPAIPTKYMDVKLVTMLTAECVSKAVDRHVGRTRSIYGLAGKKIIAQGKDLTQIKYVIGTGGALVKMSGGKALLKAIQNYNRSGDMLLPSHMLEILLDQHYLLAPLGVLATRYPRAALHLAMESLNASIDV